MGHTQTSQGQCRACWIKSSLDEHGIRTSGQNPTASRDSHADSSHRFLKISYLESTTPSSSMPTPWIPTADLACDEFYQLERSQTWTSPRERVPRCPKNRCRLQPRKWDLYIQGSLYKLRIFQTTDVWRQIQRINESDFKIELYKILCKIM